MAIPGWRNCVPLPTGQAFECFHLVRREASGFACLPSIVHECRKRPLSRSTARLHGVAPAVLLHPRLQARGDLTPLRTKAQAGERAPQDAASGNRAAFGGASNGCHRSRPPQEASRGRPLCYSALRRAGSPVGSAVQRRRWLAPFVARALAPRRVRSGRPVAPSGGGSQFAGRGLLATAMHDCREP